MNWEFVRRVGLAWTGLTFVSVFFTAFRPLARYFWLAPALLGPIAFAFVRRGYSVRRLWAFALTTYVLVMTVVFGWVVGFLPTPITTDVTVFAAFWYVSILLAFGISYSVVYRGGYSWLKRLVVC